MFVRRRKVVLSSDLIETTKIIYHACFDGNHDYLCLNTAVTASLLDIV